MSWSLAGHNHPGAFTKVGSDCGSAYNQAVGPTVAEANCGYERNCVECPFV